MNKRTSLLYNSEIETLPAGKLRLLQSERLREQVAYLYDRVPHYRAKLDEAGVRSSWRFPAASPGVKGGS